MIVLLRRFGIFLELRVELMGCLEIVVDLGSVLEFFFLFL